MSKSTKEPFVFTNEIVHELLANDWQLGVLSGGGPEGLSFDELRAGGWTDKQIHRIRSMDLVPGWQHEQTNRHRFVLHAWDGFLDHMQETRVEHGWKNTYTNTLAAFCTTEEWTGHTTLNPGAFGVTGPATRRKTLIFQTYTLERVEQLIRDALIDTRTDRLRDLDW